MRVGRGLPVLAAAWALAPSVASAADWSVDRNVELSCGVDDNYGLGVDARRRADSLSLTGGIGASRATENAVTSLAGQLTDQLLRGDIGQNELQDKLTLSQTLNDPIDHFEMTATLAHDNTLQTPTSSADLLLGRGLRRSSGATAAWTRRLTERLGASLDAGLARTAYGLSLAGAKNYQSAAIDAGLQYAWDERDNLHLGLGHSDYRTEDGSARSLGEHLSLGLGRALDETQRATIDLGVYRTRTAAWVDAQVCPLDISLCQSGVVNYITVQRLGHRNRWGAQFGLSWNAQFDERTSARVAVNRQEDPSGAGVTVRSDTVAASVRRALAPTTDGGLAYTLSRSTYQGLQQGPQPRLQTLAATISRQVSPAMTVRAGYQYTRSDEPFTGRSAHSNNASVSLRYEWPRLEATR